MTLKMALDILTAQDRTCIKTKCWVYILDITKRFQISPKRYHQKICLKDTDIQTVL